MLETFNIVSWRAMKSGDNFSINSSTTSRLLWPSILNERIEVPCCNDVFVPLAKDPFNPLDIFPKCSPLATEPLRFEHESQCLNQSKVFAPQIKNPSISPWLSRIACKHSLKYSPNVGRLMPFETNFSTTEINLVTADASIFPELISSAGFIESSTVFFSTNLLFALVKSWFEILSVWTSLSKRAIFSVSVSVSSTSSCTPPIAPLGWVKVPSLDSPGWTDLRCSSIGLSLSSAL